MRILLVNPPKRHERLYTLRDEICFQDVRYVPFPLRLAQLAAVLRERGHDVRVVDANALDLSFEATAESIGDAQAVVFQSAAGLIDFDSQVATLAKRAPGGPLVVMIESVVSPIYPERILADFPDIDVVIRGEPETVVPDVVERPLQDVRGIAWRDGETVRVNELSHVRADLARLAMPAYDLFEMRRYTITTFDAPFHEREIAGIRMRTTRDCPYGCAFCIIGSSPARGYDRKWRARPAEAVADEIDHVVRVYGIRGFFFWDETFTLDRKRAADLCRRIIDRKLNIVWRCLTRIDCMGDDLIALMRGAGCRLIEFGIESGDESVRRELSKRFSDRDVLRVVRACRRAGIRVNCDLIVGLPWETHRTLAATARLAKRMRADNVHLTMAFPYPATSFGDTVESEGLLAVDDLYDLMVHTRVRVGARAVARTRELSVEELDDAWRTLRSEIDRHAFWENVVRDPREMAGVLGSVRSAGDLLGLAPKGARFLKAKLFRGKREGR